MEVHHFLVLKPLFIFYLNISFDTILNRSSNQKQFAILTFNSKYMICDDIKLVGYNKNSTKK